MSQISQLYQEVILDHNKNPRNFGVLDHHNHFAEGKNPLCGDQIDIMMVIENGIITDIKFNGSGCAISKASASIMTSVLKGKSAEEAQKMFEEFQAIITSDTDEELDLEQLGKLAVFAGVREFPARVKCAGLAWHTMLAAVQSDENPVSTEN